jgi:hypothetical protein
LLVPSPELRERLNVLKEAILGGPDRISAFRVMPFAIFVYAPHEEFDLREALHAMAGELRRHDIEARHVSLAELAHAAVSKAQAEDGGWEAIYAGERRRKNCKSAVQTVQHALAQASPLADFVVEELRDVDPLHTVIFLGRIGALYPAYRSHALLAELAGRIKVPTILLYPGRRTADGGIEFLEELPSDASTYARIF